MISLLEQKLGKLTDNKALIDALVAIADRAPHEFNKGLEWRKPLRQAMAAFKELYETGYVGVPVDQLHDIMRKELFMSENITTEGGFRRYIVAQVALAMWDQKIVPKASKKGLLEKLSATMLKACGEPAGGVHKHAMVVVKAIKDSVK
jgi:hypothetical protein